MEELLKNDDIKRLIFSFGTIEHRIFTKKLKDRFLLLNKIRKKNIKNIENEFRKFYMLSEVHPYSISKFIHNRFSKIKQQDFLKQLNSCYCCTKHSYNKNPFKIQIEYKFPNETCRCACRHMSRHVYISLNIDEENHLYENSVHSDIEYVFLKDIN